MKNNNLLQDKLHEVRIKPSEGVWNKIEAGLDNEDRFKSLKRWSVAGWAAAVLILASFYITGNYTMEPSAYTPQNLEINDHAADPNPPADYYPSQNRLLNYRRDGRLLPNYTAVWENSLIPREKSM